MRSSDRPFDTCGHLIVCPTVLLMATPRQLLRPAAAVARKMMTERLPLRHSKGSSGDAHFGLLSNSVSQSLLLWLNRSSEPFSGAPWVPFSWVRGGRGCEWCEECEWCGAQGNEQEHAAGQQEYQSAALRLSCSQYSAREGGAMAHGPKPKLAPSSVGMLRYALRVEKNSSNLT